MNSAVVRTCERIGAGLGGLAVLIALVTGQTWGMTLGVALGAIVALANFVAIRVLVTRALTATKRDSKSAAAMSLLFGFKLLALVVFVWISIRFFGADTTGFLFGVTAVFVAVIVVSLLGAGMLSGPDAPADETPESQDGSAGSSENLSMTTQGGLAGAVMPQEELRG